MAWDKIKNLFKKENATLMIHWWVRSSSSDKWYLLTLQMTKTLLKFAHSIYSEQQDKYIVFIEKKMLNLITSLLFNGKRRVMKSRITRCAITFPHEHVTSLTPTVWAVRFLIEITVILKMKKYYFIGSYSKENLTLVVILYEIYETSLRRLVS